MKKKLLSIILAVVMTMGLLAGCGSSSDSDKTSDSSKSKRETSDTAGSSTSDDAQADDSKTSTSGGKILVVYYSATGSTKTVAETIADKTGGDLFEIEPKEPYTDADLNWSNDDSRVSKEHDDESLRDVELVSTTVDNWDSYDTVFIGYPKMEYSL